MAIQAWDYIMIICLMPFRNINNTFLGYTFGTLLKVCPQGKFLNTALPCNNNFIMNLTSTNFNGVAINFLLVQ